MPLHPGASLDHGKYAILRPLDRGGYGVVYLAEDGLLRTEVAIKELISPLTGDEAALKRFLAEAGATMRLTHERIVRTHNVFSEGGAYFTVMEFMPGGSLEARLRAVGALAVADAVHVAADVAEGLAYAHAHGVVHCDLKPANILFTGDGHAKIGDFGIAHVSGEALTRTWMTAAGFVAGTLPYMSPEQADGVRDDPRIDVYALGAVLYRMLCARPYQDFDDHETPGAQADNVYLIRHGIVKAPSAYRRDIPPWLDHAVLRALAKRPEDRFPSINDMRTALLTREVALPAPVRTAPPPDATVIIGQPPPAQPAAAPFGSVRAHTPAPARAAAPAVLRQTPPRGPAPAVAQPAAPAKGQSSWKWLWAAGGAVVVVLLILIALAAAPPGKTRGGQTVAGTTLEPPQVIAALASATQQLAGVPAAATAETPTRTPAPEPTWTAAPAVLSAPTDTATPRPPQTSRPARTSTETRVPISTPLPTSTPVPTLTPEPTNTPEPSVTPRPTRPPPTPTVTPSRPTATARPAATAAPKAGAQALTAPSLLGPAADATASRPTTFRWRWEGRPLAANEAFEVRIWKAGQPAHYGAAEPTTGTSLTIDLAAAYGVQLGGSGNYLWTVAVVERNPYKQTGPEAAPRRLVVVEAGGGTGGGGGGGGDTPPATWTPPPP